MIGNVLKIMYVKFEMNTFDGSRDIQQKQNFIHFEKLVTSNSLVTKSFTFPLQFAEKLFNFAP